MRFACSVPYKPWWRGKFPTLRIFLRPEFESYSQGWRSILTNRESMRRCVRFSWSANALVNGHLVFLKLSTGRTLRFKSLQRSCTLRPCVQGPTQLPQSLIQTYENTPVFITLQYIIRMPSSTASNEFLILTTR